MRLLVTGGAGYIGSVVTSVLLDAGHDVTVLDNLSTGHDHAVAPGARLVRLPVHKAGQILAGHDGVLHLAGRSLVAESVTEPQVYWRQNVVDTLSLLDAMHECGVSRAVFSSSSAVYGRPTKLPMDVDTPTVPATPYGASKLAVEMILTSYAHAYGLAATSLRYFNVAGAVGPYGERHEHETHLVPIALDAAAGARGPLIIYGDDHATRDGSAIRDYLHVRDLAEAHLLAVEQVEPGRHTIYNVGSGVGISVLEMVTAVEHLTGRTVPTIVHARRPGEAAELVADPQLTCRELGWQPKHTLREIICDAWAFRNFGTAQ